MEAEIISNKIIYNMHVFHAYLRMPMLFKEKKEKNFTFSGATLSLSLMVYIHQAVVASSEHKQPTNPLLILSRATKGKK